MLMKRCQWNAISVVVALTVYSIAVVIDVYCSHWMSERQLLSFLPNLSLSKSSFQTILSVMTAFMALSFTIYNVLIQVYRHRYPIDFVSLHFSSTVENLSKHLMINIIIGILLLVNGSEASLLMNYAYLLHTTYCFGCVVKFSRTYTSLKIADTLEKHRETIISSIDSKKIQISSVNNQLVVLEKYSEDSFAKNELQIAKLITKSYVEMVVYFLKNKDTLIIDGNYKASDIEALEETLFSSIIDQVKLSVNYGYKNYLEECFCEIKYILDMCIKCDKLATFKNYSKLLDQLFQYSILREVLVGCYIIDLYGSLAKHIITESLSEPWFEAITSEFEFYGLTTQMHLEPKLIKILMARHFFLLETCLKKGKLDKYKVLRKNTFRLFRENINKSNSDFTKYLEMLFYMHSSSLLDSQNYELEKEHIALIEKIGQSALNDKNKDGSLFAYNALCQMEENSKNKEVQDLIRKTQFNLASKAIDFNVDLAAIYVPEYSEFVKKTSSQCLLDEAVESYKYLLRRTILGKNTEFTLYLLGNISKIALTFNKDKRAEQTRLIKLYVSALELAIKTEAKDCFYATIQDFEDLIVELDKDNKISHELFKDVLDDMKNCASIAIREKQIGFAIGIIGVLVDFIDNLNLLAKQKDLFLIGIDVVFQIGLDAIENDIDDIIRNVSNHLGWSCKKAIDNTDGDKVKAILDKASTLYNLTIEFGIGEKTTIFIGTLFVILGGYCSSINKTAMLAFLISHSKGLKRQELLNKARLMRAQETQTWNVFMKGDSKKYIDEFWSRITPTAVLSPSKKS